MKTSCSGRALSSLGLFGQHLPRTPTRSRRTGAPARRRPAQAGTRNEIQSVMAPASATTEPTRHRAGNLAAGPADG